MEKGRKHHKNSWNKIVQVGEEEEHVLVLMLLLAIVKVLLVFWKQGEQNQPQELKLQCLGRQMTMC